MSLLSKRTTLAALLCGVLCTSPLIGDTPAPEWQPPEVKAPDWPPEIRERNAEMKRRVDAWLADGTEAEMPLHVVYLSCTDQEPFPDHTQRLNRVLSEVQHWFAVQHEAAGFGPVTIDLQRNDEGRVKLHEGKLPFTVESRRNENRRETHGACNAESKRLLSAAGIDFDHAFVLILTTIPDDHGAAPFYGIILQNRGYCFAVDTPWLDSNYTKIDGPHVWKGKPVGPANSALIGGIAHELGHGLGLPHSDEPASQKPLGESLMASGNYSWREEQRGQGRGSFLLNSDAMLLIARPPFAGRKRDFDKQPQVTLQKTSIQQLEDGRLQLKGTIATDIPAHAIKLFDDPPGNNDYNALAHAALPDEETGEFEITFEPLPAAGEHALRLVLMHVNGRWTQVKTSITVGDDEKIDLSKAQQLWNGK